MQYARNGSVRLAYRIWGDKDPTLVWVPGWISNVDAWDIPGPVGFMASFPDHLARRTRLIAWDKRGTGLSDPTTHVPPLDERMDDLRAVMDAADAQCPALLGISEGGPMSILFAATYPERVRSMVLYGTLPRFSPDPPDYLWGLDRAQLAELQDDVENQWGEGALADFFFGEMADIPGFRDLYGRVQRTSASPTMAWMLLEAWSDIDVRPILDAVRVPTLVLGRDGDRFAPVEASKARSSATRSRSSATRSRAWAMAMASASPSSVTPHLVHLHRLPDLGRLPSRCGSVAKCLAATLTTPLTTSRRTGETSARTGRITRSPPRKLGLIWAR